MTSDANVWSDFVHRFQDQKNAPSESRLDLIYFEFISSMSGVCLNCWSFGVECSIQNVELFRN